MCLRSLPGAENVRSPKAILICEIENLPNLIKSVSIVFAHQADTVRPLFKVGWFRFWSNLLNLGKHLLRKDEVISVKAKLGLSLLSRFLYASSRFVGNSFSGVRVPIRVTGNSFRGVRSYVPGSMPDSPSTPK